MGAERQGSKVGGGYVGGFFQLFDWNAKSRKKLFSNKSDLPERSKQGKKSNATLPMTRLHLMDEYEIGVGSSMKGSSDYSCASSVTDDEGCGSRAPGVVARLMGLDSLPPPTSMEPYSTPFFDSQSLRDAHYRRKNFDFHHDNQVTHSGNLLNNVGGATRTAMESKPQKMLNRPIEKFQTEILPPKSAKSIPITHHKLLSPIKSPGFIPTKNAAHIMEAAAKIIESSSQTTAKAKMPLVGSSAPLKIRDLKEKVEAPQKPCRNSEASRRPIESNAAKHLKGQSLTKSWNGSEDSSLKVSSDAEEILAGFKNKGKSISLAIQAKVNVQRREGLNPSSSRSLVGQKEQREVKSSQPFKSQLNLQKTEHKKASTHNASHVLRQNNLKQNCLMDREKSSAKPSVSNSHGRKGVAGESPVGRHKGISKSPGISKAGSRKLGLDVTDSEKGVSYSRSKSLPRKKRFIDGDSHFEKQRANRVVDNLLTNKTEKPVQFNPVNDRHYGWTEDNRKKGMDVVSFTFTAPMTRSLPSSEASSQVAERTNGKKVLVDSNITKMSSLGCNVIGGDALSVLLEQKLKELTYGIESSSFNSTKVGQATNISSFLHDLVPTINVETTTPSLQVERDHHDLGGHFVPDFYSTEPSELKTRHTFQGLEEGDRYGHYLVEARQLFDCRHPSPVSILESFPAESCNSSDSMESNYTEGSLQSSSVQAQVFGLGSKKFHPVEADTELSDSASSTSAGMMGRKHAITVTTKDFVNNTKWELEYVKEVLCNVELMFKDFALGRAREIINPHLFDKLEIRKGGLICNVGESKLGRKVLFDCVSECLDLRCRRYVGGGCRMWAKGVAMVRRKQWLAEEVYKEISGWRGMGDCMVDELVDKDMSSQYGGWLDFEAEAFSLGVLIEGDIFNSLVDEVVADILLS